MPTPSETLAILDQKIQDIVSGGVSEVEFNNIRYTALDIDKLIRLRDHLQSRADAADATSAGAAGVSRVEFGRPR